MGKVEIELNTDGIAELLKSEEMKAVVKAEIDRITGEVDDGERKFAGTVKVGKYRVVGKVKPANLHARRSNLKHNTLLKALTGGKG